MAEPSVDQWLVVTFHRGCEIETCKSIEAQDGFRAFLPLYLKRVRNGRRWERVLRPLFGEYGFAQAIGVSWKPIAHTRGVKRVMMWPNGMPQYVPDEVMVELLNSAGEPLELDEKKPRKHFEIGQPIRITAGAHQSLVGLYARHERDRVVALLTYLGQEREVELPEEMVEAVKRDNK
jgi:transcription antitermination factor NusG